MKQIILPITGAIFFIVLVGLLTQKIQNGKLSFPNNKNTVLSQQSEVKINDLVIPVKIANTDTKRRTGLASHDSLPKEEGMLFKFAQKNVQPPFWMKNMKFAIDIIWIDDGVIVQIDKDVQPPTPNTPDEELTLYAPDQLIDYVLEVNASFTEENGIKIGDTVNSSSFK